MNITRGWPQNTILYISKVRDFAIYTLLTTGGPLSTLAITLCLCGVHHLKNYTVAWLCHVIITYVWCVPSYYALVCI